MKKCIFSLLLALLPFVSEAQTKPTGIKVGEKAPSVTGYDQNGKLTDLDVLLKKGPVVLFFYRGAWCPYCRKQVANLQESLDMITAKGASVVAVTPSGAKNIAKMVEKNGVGFHIIHDKGLKIMDAYDVTFVPSEKMQKKFMRIGINLGKINGDNGWKLPIPATYIIDRSGKIVYAHFDPNYKKRPSVSTIIKNLPK